jgi:hypothetical protein
VAVTCYIGQWMNCSGFSAERKVLVPPTLKEILALLYVASHFASVNEHRHG